MDSQRTDGEANAFELLGDELTNELAALDLAATAGSQIAATTADSVVDPNVLALRRVDAEVRQLMESWVGLESQLNKRDAEIRRLSDRGRSVEEDVQATRHELAAARADCERLRGEGANQRAQADEHKRLQREHREQAERLKQELVAAHGRISQLDGELGQARAGGEKLEIQLAEHRDALTGMAAQLRKFEKASNGQDNEKAALAARIADMDRVSAELTSRWRDAENSARQAKEQLLAISRRAEGLENELRKAREQPGDQKTEKALDLARREAEAVGATRIGKLQHELNVERENSSALRKQLKTSEIAISQAAAALESQRQKTEAAAIAAAGEREKFVAQLDELRKQLSAADSEFRAKRRSIAALDTEFNRLGLIQANVRKLDDMMSQQLSGGGMANDDEERPRNGRLIVSLDGEKAVKYPLFKSDMVIGRALNTDIRVAGRHTSRHHARVFIDRGVVMIEDLGSLNGITVNGKTVRKHELHDGDLLNVGGARLRFVDIDEKAAPPRNGVATAP
jgi:chromosome segregation ATPase